MIHYNTKMAQNFPRFTALSPAENELKLEEVCRAVGREVAREPCERIMRGEKYASCNVDLEVIATDTGLKLVVQKRDECFQQMQAEELALFACEFAKMKAALKRKGFAVCSGCSATFKRKKLYRCSQCAKVCYCCVKCQRDDWERGHSKICKLMKEHA